MSFEVKITSFDAKLLPFNFVKIGKELFYDYFYRDECENSPFLTPSRS